MIFSSSGVGERVDGTSDGIASGNPVAARTSSTDTPGCTERSRIDRSGVAKSSTARFVTTTRISIAPRSWPTPLTMSTRGTNTRGACRGTQ
jgi:hypothetical protein